MKRARLILSRLGPAAAFACCLALQSHVTASTPAAASGAPAAETAGTVLPGRVCRGYFIVDFQPGGRAGETLGLLLDTGASRTYVDPDALARVLGRPARAGKVVFRGARAGPLEVPTLRARVSSMEILSLAIGSRIDGILGFDAFRDVLLTLDYPRGEVRVSTGTLPPPDGREIFKDVGRGRPYLSVPIGGRVRKVLLDSGSTGIFRLKPTDPLEWIEPPRPVGVSVLFAGVAPHEAGRAQGSLQVGPVAFQDPIVDVSQRERLAGWQVLRRFTLTFDQRKRRIRMLADDGPAVRLGPMIRTPLGLRPRREGMEVLLVLPGSSAEAAGLRKGDLITAIDGVPVHDRGCVDPFAQAAGERQVFTFLRDGERSEATIETEVLVP